MDSFPFEILEKIFLFMDKDTLSTAERVCFSWSTLIVTRFWHFQLKEVAQTDFALRSKFKDAGWHPNDSDNYDVIRSLYIKMKDVLPNNWTNPPEIRDLLINSYTPANFNSGKASSFIEYKDKIFIGLKNSVVESRDRSTLNLRRQLNNVPDVLNEHILRSCPLAFHGKTLAGIDGERRHLLLWQADTEELVAKVPTPHGRLYDVKMNATNIICLCSWSLLIWRHDSFHPVDMVNGPSEIRDFEPSAHYQNWLECHSIEMNEKYIVTHATRILLEGGHDRRSVSFLHVRRVGPDGVIGPVLRPDDSAAPNNVVEIDRIKLSSDNLLAILQVEEFFSNPNARLSYTINIMDVETSQTIHSIPSAASIFSIVQVPVQWLGSKLFFKVVPKPDYDEAAILATWDASNGESTTINSVRMITSNDLLTIGHSHVVQIYHKFPDAVSPDYGYDSEDENHDYDPDREPEFQVRGAIYDFWGDG